MKQYTDHDIIRFLSEEMSAEESDAFLSVLATDEALWERYEQFQESLEQLSAAELAPSQQSVEKVMAFVAETSPAPSELEALTQVEEETRKPAIHTFKAGPVSLRVNLNAVIVMSLTLFVSVALFGSIYKLNRGQVLRPNTGPLVETKASESDHWMQWDDSDLYEQLDEIKVGIDALDEKEGPTL
ncbi:MAG: hypothetical protein AAFV07_04600 [Bacteroidota bacterium]